MAKAKHKVTGVRVTADADVLGRLGPEWETESPGKDKAPAKRSSKSKSDDDK